MDLVVIDGIYVNRDRICFVKPYSPKNPLFAGEDWCRVYFGGGDDFIEFRRPANDILTIIGARLTAFRDFQDAPPAPDAAPARISDADPSADDPE